VAHEKSIHHQDGGRRGDKTKYTAIPVFSQTVNGVTRSRDTSHRHKGGNRGNCGWENPVTQDGKALIEVLRGQLVFIERGGYRNPEHAVWRAQYMFQDSPTCINRDPTEPRKPCSECPLVALVPEEQREKRVPCRYIPLNEVGETVDSLYRTGTQRELEAVVVAWLKATIDKLEREAEKAFQETPTVHVKAKVVSFG
jgi:hypothetical protein